MNTKLSRGAISSIIYHDKFDYPLKEQELVKWKSGIFSKSLEIDKLNGFYFLKGKKGNIEKRKLREKYSISKFSSAKNAANLLKTIPSLLFVGVTGSLSMMNADKNSDIDLMLITKKDTLWVTRALVLLIFKVFNISIRRFNDKDERDKICTNLWLDETEIFWKDKNIYTAHEIAQIVPLVNKNKTYEKFIKKNLWIRSFWPNAVDFNTKSITTNYKKTFLFRVYLLIAHLFEPLAFLAQYLYMKEKITREIVTKHKAVFHPIERSTKIRAAFPLDNPKGYY